MPSAGAEIVLWIATGFALVGFHSILNAALTTKPAPAVPQRVRPI